MSTLVKNDRCTRCHQRLVNTRGQSLSKKAIQTHVTRTCPGLSETRLHQRAAQTSKAAATASAESVRQAAERYTRRHSKRRRDEGHEVVIVGPDSSVSSSNDSRPRKTPGQGTQALNSPERPPNPLPTFVGTSSAEMEMEIEEAQVDWVDTEGPANVDEMPALQQTVRGTGRLPPRTIRLPSKYRDAAPAAPALKEAQSSPSPEPAGSDHSTPERQSFLLRPFRTIADAFGRLRIYLTRPPKEPDVDLTAQDFHDTDGRGESNLTTAFNTSKGDISSDERSPIWPFPNISSLLFLNWFHNGQTNKSLGERKSLIQTVFEHPFFDAKAISESGLRKIEKLLKSADSDSTSPLYTGEGWKAQSIKLSVPFVGGVPQSYVVEGFHRRSLVSVFTEAMKEPRPPAAAWHWDGHREYVKSPTPAHPDHTERIFSEIFTSEGFLEEEEKVKQLPPEKNDDGTNCDLPRAIAGLMLYSDGTQLGNVGANKLWPVMAFPGNQSKAARVNGKGTGRDCYHIAYLPSLPPEIHKWVQDTSASLGISQKASPALLAHLRRELFQKCIKKILDPEFIQAYKHGVVVDCGDGIRRRVYFRIMTYSADYPEKVLIATIRDNGQCPCFRCLIEKKDIHKLGMLRGGGNRKLRIDDDDRKWKVDRARSLIHDKSKPTKQSTKKSYKGKGSKGKAFVNRSVGVNAKKVEDILKPTSLVPTTNAFSERLGPLGFDFHQMLVPDILHETLLGTWKTLFVILLRLLYAINPEKVPEFDERYRSVPTFTGDRIRGIHGQPSETKSLTAARYQDLLLCCLPVIEGLFLDMEPLVRKVVFCAADWLSLAKLHLHTESTLRLLRQRTRRYGQLTRKLVAECKKYKLRETPREKTVRLRRVATSTATSTAKPPAQTAKGKGKSTVPPGGGGLDIPDTVEKGALEKEAKTDTIKHHLMEHTPEGIEYWGTTPSYSSSIGESEHKTSKNKWRISNFRDFETQLGNTLNLRERIRRLYLRLEDAMDWYRFKLQPGEREAKDLDSSEGPIASQGDADGGDDVDPDQEEDVTSEAELDDLAEPGDTSVSPRRYIIGLSSRKRETIKAFQKQHENDPMAKNFFRKLKEHIAVRTGLAETVDYDSSIQIYGKCLYFHSTLRSFYTTYDVRRGQDTVNCSKLSREHCNVMVQADDEGREIHPFWYARVLRIFHAYVLHPSCPGGERMDFLWVRWFGMDLQHKSGWKAEGLDRIGFLHDPDHPDHQFGFIDPNDIIRAVHLIPAFNHGQTLQFLRRPSRYRSKEGDWMYYYVNRFADRDMMMRYTDLAIGHTIPGGRKSEPKGKFQFDDVSDEEEESHEAPSDDAEEETAGGGGNDGQERGRGANSAVATDEKADEEDDEPDPGDDEPELGNSEVDVDSD